ncbi:1-phosphofructokinase family hexose kinase [Streptomyces sp. NPDC002671]
MILTVTLNPALDITYRVDRLLPRASIRVRDAVCRAGGKGVNVSRVLHALGHPTAVTGLVGGPTGEAVRRDLATAGLTDHLVATMGETRRTVAVVDEQAGDTTILLEPGPPVSAAEWAAFLDRFEQLLDGTAALVLSGSLPPGLPSDAYGVLLRLAHSHDVPAVLDAEGPALLAGLPEEPAVIKPNADELIATTGQADPLRAAQSLLTAGARAVVASLGPAGLLAVTPQGCWRARPPRRIAGNPTGAGDAAVAALALGVVGGTPWPAQLVEAVALSAAAVAAPQAGDFDPGVHRSLLEQVTVERLTPREGVPACR